MTRAEQQQQAEIETLIGSKYQVLCRIGGGGMAQVLLARHRLHGGLFAIKILSDHLAQDPSIVARFKQEATTAASLSGHPNIVTIFDIGEGNGLHYLVMQFVCGEDLASFIRREGKLPPPAAAGIIAQTAEALSWAESKRVVHRDLKPANIHLDTSGRIKILDFGISKITDIADGLTRPGESLGTPFYMSPEQIRGEGCDVRSDLYSLGVVFFELLSGRRPFESESATAIQIAHLSTPPPLLLDIDPTLPPMCEQIIQKLLRKDRKERYQTAQELLDDLYANGASSGPTILRPVIDPGLQEQIDRSAAAHKETTTVCAPAPVPAANASSATNFDSLANVATASGVASKKAVRGLAPVPSSQAAEAPATDEAPSATQAGAPKSRVVPFALATAAVLLLAIIGLLFAFRSKPQAVAVNKPLDPVLETAHGRMLLVPAGNFIFGDKSADSPQPQQTLHLPAYYLDETEVSNAEYLRFSQATGHAFENAAYASAHPDEPVIDVSEADAEAYAAWAGKRLPTEEEWEKAARGTDGRPFPWGATPWTQDVPDHLQPVSSFPERRSPYGAYNMAGNAWEWTASHFPVGERELADMRQALKTGDFSKVWHVIKGGSFSPNGSAGFRVYLRRGFPEDQHSPVIGFRCVKDAGGS